MKAAKPLRTGIFIRIHKQNRSECGAANESHELIGADRTAGSDVRAKYDSAINVLAINSRFCLEALKMSICAQG